MEARPPVEAALTRVDYTLRATADTVSGEARLAIDVLKQGWVSVQVPSGLLVRDARLDGQRTALVAGTPPRVLISKAGRSTLTLDVVVPLASSAGSDSMLLPASGSAVSGVTLIIPRTIIGPCANRSPGWDPPLLKWIKKKSHAKIRLFEPFVKCAPR